MRRLALILALLVTGTAGGLAASATGEDSHTYFIELDNAFGLIDGSEVKVAGVVAGTIQDLDVNAEKRAVIEVELSGPLSALGEDTRCSSEPQSLIAEYFLDCNPKGPPLPEDGSTEDPDIPVEQVTQTVQNDLVLDSLRRPYAERLRLLINEFGTGLAGNPEELNAAIRRGAPALRELRAVLRILGDQNRIIRDLNVDADRIIARLEERSDDVVRFIEDARDAASASADRRADLSQDFAKLDDFLAELRPTMTRLGELARDATPVLADLDRSAGGLDQLARDLPGFNRATEESLTALGEASVVGDRALKEGREEIDQLERSGRKAAPVADLLADLLRDLDDPNRAVEVDARAARDTGREEPTGYTALEGLLNYAYYQAGSTNQFDQVGHLLHFSLFEILTGPCEGFVTGFDSEGTPGVPASDGGTTTDIRDAHRCVSWLGENQPDINEPLNLPSYDPSVCPEGSDAPRLCDPNGPSTQAKAVGDGDGDGGASGPGREERRGGDQDGGDRGGEPGGNGGEPGGNGGNDGGDGGPATPRGPEAPPRSGGLDGLLDPLGRIGEGGLEDLGKGLGDALGELGNGSRGSRGGNGSGGGQAADDLLDFLFGN